ncbi:MAG: Fic family protein [Anaerocolumna sp.]
MKEIDYNSIQHMTISMEVMNMVSLLHEHKGKQELYLATQPQTLERLMEIAKIQSVESSNKIEGIFTSDSRLKEIVMKKSEPRNRNEKEIAGYREVLSMIHDSYSYIQLKQNDILTLHKYLYMFTESSYGGHYKISDNYISETDENGKESIRFKPVEAMLTPDYMRELCDKYNDAIHNTNIDSLLIIPCVILDFLCIHPFSDGNGRMSRLLTLLLLYKAGYLVGKYVSIDMVVEKSKETYYEALQDSSMNWHENESTYMPFIRYTLGTLINAYRDFEERFVSVEKKKMSSADRVYSVIEKSLVKLSKSDIMTLCPELSQKTIERALKKLVEEEKIAMIGVGRSTSYIGRDRV